MSSHHMEVRPDDIQYDTKIVAFLDILGFKNLIRKATVAAQAKNIIYLLEQALMHSKPREVTAEGTVRMFSDCISISSAPTLEGIGWILWRCIVIQGLLIQNGYLLRGAVTEGKHYESDNIIFSEALVNSYELEKSAVYPRIIVETGVVTRARETNQTDQVCSPAKDLLLQDQDGMIFLDYFRFMEVLSNIHSTGPAPWESEALTPSEFLERHQELIDEGLIECADRPHLLQKYYWMATFQKRNDRFQVPLDILDSCLTWW